MLQSHSVITTLRSSSCGRSGRAAGSSPAATRSVQSAYCLSMRCVSVRASPFTICIIAWPEVMRRAQASSEDLKWPSAAGTVRVAAVPSAWQPMQPLVFTVSSHSCWLAALPIGNSLFSGMVSIAYQ